MLEYTFEGQRQCYQIWMTINASINATSDISNDSGSSKRATDDVH